MDILVEREEVLFGSTYKVKVPSSCCAYYITINDREVEGERVPYEIFINTKSMENYAWIVGLTRTISTMLRSGLDPTTLVEDLCSIVDPLGGYHKSCGKYVPSLVAEIGECVKTHIVRLK